MSVGQFAKVQWMAGQTDLVEIKKLCIIGVTTICPRGSQ